MKKQYYFILVIFIMFYLMYLIVTYKYREYKVNTVIESLEKENIRYSTDIGYNKATLEYLNTLAYKDKILKETQNLKNPAEQVVMITSKERYDKIINPIVENPTNEQIEKNVYDNMTNYEKWIYFIFKKDIR